MNHFHDTFMVLLCSFWSLKAPVPIHCKCVDKSNWCKSSEFPKTESLERLTLRLERRKFGFRTTWGWENNHNGFYLKKRKVWPLFACKITSVGLFFTYVLSVSLHNLFVHLSVSFNVSLSLSLCPSHPLLSVCCATWNETPLLSFWLWVLASVLELTHSVN